MAHVQKRVSVQKRTGKTITAWQARFVGPDGRERTRRFDRKVDAEAWLATNGADIARGAWVDPESGKVTFRTYANGWLATKVDVSARTRINIEGRLSNHALPHFGDMSMANVRPGDVRAFVGKLTAAGKAPSTVKGIFLTVSQVFEQAVIDAVIAKSPCAGVKLPADRQGEEMHFLTPAQVDELADAISERYRTLIYTAAYAGLRAGELVALKVDAIALGELGGTIAITGAASEVRGELVFGPTKTGRKRVVGIPRFLSQMLSEHIERYPSADGLVFAAHEGGPIRHRNLYRRHFRPAVVKARTRALADDRDDDALPAELRFHDLRHTCAAILIANGRHIEEVKDHLGHGSIRTTSDRYGHLLPSARVALADSLEATFRSTRSAATDTGRTRLEIRVLPDTTQGAI